MARKPGRSSAVFGPGQGAGVPLPPQVRRESWILRKGEADPPASVSSFASCECSSSTTAGFGGPPSALLAPRAWPTYGKAKAAWTGEGWAVGRQARAAGQARSEPWAVGPVSQELGARPVRPRGRAGAGTKAARLPRPLMGQDVSSRGSSFACKSSSGPLFFEGKQKDVCVFVRTKPAWTSLPQ